MKRRRNNWRYFYFKDFSILIIIYGLIFFWLVFCLFQLQILNHQSFLVQAQKQFDFYQILLPKRGTIFAQDKFGNLYPLALTRESYNLYLYLPQVKNVDETLALIQEVLPEINNKKNFHSTSSKTILLAKYLEKKQMEKIKKLNLPGVFFEKIYQRFYPFKDIGARFLGFASLDDNQQLEGRYGIEKFYNQALKGSPGFYGGGINLKFPQNGADLILTIDINLQREAYRLIKEGVKTYQASEGMILIGEAKTGKILALAEYPSYDPNHYNKISDYSLFLTKANQNYEPGSVMKPFTFAIGLDRNLITPETEYFDEGTIIINGEKISNYDKKAHGKVSLQTALNHSYNLGAIFVISKIGKEIYRQYLNYFKLKEPVYADLPFAHKPDFKTLYPPYGREVNFATASFGQGISLTPLHLWQIFDSFANQGKIMRPYFVEKIKYPSGDERKINPLEIAKPLKTTSALEISQMLEQVVDSVRSFEFVKIKGYRIAGKTGTAQIPLKEGYSDEVISTFIGFFPVSDPQFIILVKLEKPQTWPRWASRNSALIWRKMAKFIINYYGIAPDKL